MNKSDIRKEIRLRKRQFTQQQLDELSLVIEAHILQHPKVKEAKTILLYYSLPDEVNTHQLIDKLVKQGKQVLLPVVVDSENMEIREYHSSKDLAPGCMNIMEPQGKPFIDYEKIDIALVPGMGFDSNGNRLGRGKGYYDRALNKMTKAYLIGICFDFQRIEHIPTEPHDIVMNEIID